MTQTDVRRAHRRADRIDRFLIAAVAVYGFAILARPIFPTVTLDYPRVIVATQI